MQFEVVKVELVAVGCIPHVRVTLAGEAMAGRQSVVPLDVAPHIGRRFAVTESLTLPEVHRRLTATEWDVRLVNVVEPAA